VGSGRGSWVHAVHGVAAKEWQMGARGGEWHAMKFQSDRHAAKTFVRSWRLSVQVISSTRVRMRSTRARMAYLQKPRAVVGSNAPKRGARRTRDDANCSLVAPSGVELYIVLIAVASYTAWSTGFSQHAHSVKVKARTICGHTVDAGHAHRLVR
jgi:hypothetical protein